MFSNSLRTYRNPYGAYCDVCLAPVRRNKGMYVEYGHLFNYRYMFACDACVDTAIAWLVML